MAEGTRLTADELAELRRMAAGKTSPTFTDLARGLERALAHIATLTPPTSEEVARDFAPLSAALKNWPEDVRMPEDAALARLHAWAVQGRALEAELAQRTRERDSEMEERCKVSALVRGMENRAEQAESERDAARQEAAAFLREVQELRQRMATYLPNLRAQVATLEAENERCAKANKLLNDVWLAEKSRAEAAEAERDAYKRDLQAEFDGNDALRKELGAKDSEIFPEFVRRLAAEREAAERRVAELEATVHGQRMVARDDAHTAAEMALALATLRSRPATPTAPAGLLEAVGPFAAVGRMLLRFTPPMSARISGEVYRAEFQGDSVGVTALDFERMAAAYEAAKGVVNRWCWACWGKGYGESAFGNLRITCPYCKTTKHGQD